MLDKIKSEALKLKNNIDAAYAAGKQSMVDPDKIIEKTAQGVTTLTLDDVSEIPHEVEVQLDSNLLEMGPDKILFQSGSLVSITENSLTGKGNGGHSIHILFEKKYEPGTYTLSLESESAENRCLVRCFDSSGNIITNAMNEYNAWYKANIINMDNKKAKFTVPNTVAYWCWGWVPRAAQDALTTITNPKIEVGDGLPTYDGEADFSQYGKTVLAKYENPRWFDADLFEGKATHTADDFYMELGKKYCFRFKAEKSNSRVFLNFWIYYVGDPLYLIIAPMEYNNGYYEYTYVADDNYQIGLFWDTYQTEFGYSGDITVTEIEIIEPLPEGTTLGAKVMCSGKNLLHLNRTLGAPSNTANANTTARLFDYDTYILGLTRNNYYSPVRIAIDTYSEDSITFTTQQASYGVVFPIRLMPNTTYTFSFKQIDENSSLCAAGHGLYDNEGTWLSHAVSTGDTTTRIVKHTFTTDEYGNAILVVTPNAAGTFTVAELQLELGSEVTSYEKGVKPIEYTSPKNGFISGIKSVSPSMSITTNNGLKIEAKYRKSYGMQTEYNRFQDSFYRTATTYTPSVGQFMFAGQGWNNETFKPNHNLKIKYGYGTFWQSGIRGDLVEILEELGIEIDFSESTSFQYCFAGSEFTRIGVIDARNATILAQLFHSQGYIETVDKLILSDTPTQAANFYSFQCVELKNITIEGAIGAGEWTFQSCTKLTKASITSIVNALYNVDGYVPPNVLAFSNTAVKNAFETSPGAADGNTSAEWEALKATKPNWSIVLR